MPTNMQTTEIPSTIGELAIVAVVLFYNKIYSLLLFMTTHELFREILIDFKEIIGILVGILGGYLMYLKIRREKKKVNESEDKKE